MQSKDILVSSSLTATLLRQMGPPGNRISPGISCWRRKCPHPGNNQRNSFRRSKEKLVSGGMTSSLLDGDAGRGWCWDKDGQEHSLVESLSSLLPSESLHPSLNKPSFIVFTINLALSMDLSRMSNWIWFVRHRSNVTINLVTVFQTGHYMGNFRQMQ